MCRSADCTGWPTVPSSRLQHMADRTGWPTAPGGRIQFEMVYNSVQKLVLHRELLEKLSVLNKKSLL
uniref:Uncharacterized protein n=1 Tax=Romanomermis culicivorax TaxID=13658 RepID=A0A915JRR3_ROMCU